jgi:hypothetical protein
MSEVLRSSLSREDCDRIALERAGRIGPGDHEHCRAQLPGGWEMRCIATGGTREGVMVLVATNKRTRSLLFRGRVAHFRACGLSPRDATYLARMRARYKFELAKILANVLEDPAQVRAFRSHPEATGEPDRHGQARKEWHDRWKGCLSSDVLGLSCPRELYLARMVSYIKGWRSEWPQ